MKKILMVSFIGVFSLMFVSPVFSLDQTNGAFTYFTAVIGVAAKTAPPTTEEGTSAPLQPQVAEAPVSDGTVVLAN